MGTEIRTGGSSDRSRPPPTSAVGAVFGLLALFLIGVAFVHFSEAPPRPAAVRMSLLLPEKSRFRALQVSPDCRHIAMVLVKEGKQQIWIRALDSLEFTPLAGTDGAESPFWSPDSRYLGFFADAKLEKIERSGGPVQTLCDALGGWAEPGIATATSYSRVTLWDGCSEFRLPVERPRTSLTSQIISETSTDASITVVLNWRAGESN